MNKQIGLSYTENMKSDGWNVSIGKVIRDALAFDPAKWGKRKINQDSIPQSVVDLFRIFTERKIEYVLVGGIAMLSYIRGRNTSDLDLILAVSSLNKVPEIQLGKKEVFFGHGEFEGLQLDFLFSEHPLFDLIREKYSTGRRFQEQEVVTATVEGLILLKLFALPSLYRQGDFVRVGLYENDVATLLNEYQPDLEGILQILHKFIDPVDIVEIEGILTELQARVAKFTYRKNDPPGIASN